MENKNIDDIKAIRTMMEQSSRFISLSGASGVLAGVIALIAAALAYYVINDTLFNSFGRNRNELISELTVKLLIIAIITLTLAFGGSILLSVKKSRKKGLKIWTKTTQRMLVHLLVPLIVGAIFCLVFYLHHVAYLIGAATLIFYGLALLNASKFTFQDIAYLGYLEIMLGIIALFFPGMALLLWALGFGVLHIIYGLVIQRKYE